MSNRRFIAIVCSLALAFALASAYGQLGDTERAIAALKRGLEFDPHNAAARRLLESATRPRNP